MQSRFSGSNSDLFGNAELGKKVKDEQLLNTSAPRDMMEMQNMRAALDGLAAQNAGLQELFLANQLGTNPNMPNEMYWNQEVAPGVTRRTLADSDFYIQRKQDREPLIQEWMANDIKNIEAGLPSDLSLARYLHNIGE